MIVQHSDRSGVPSPALRQAVPRPPRAVPVPALHGARGWSSTGIRDADLRAPGLSISVLSAPCSGEHGGDICHLGVGDDGRSTRVVLADVTGHGRSVVQMGRFVHDALADHMDASGGDALLRAVNDAAIVRGPFAMTTAVVVGFSMDTRELELTYAGHAPVLLLRAGATRPAAIEPPLPALDERGPTRNVALAVCEQVAFDPVRLTLARGDRLLLYTDGATDARDACGRAFGETGIVAALESAAAEALPKVPRALAEAIRRHTGSGLGHDDVTFVALQVE